jgi:hypothetical protein
MKRPIPLTPLDNIKDPDVRLAFRSLVDYLGGIDFVTMDDLTGGSDRRNGNRAPVGATQAGGSGAPASVWNTVPKPGAVGAIIGMFENAVTESALFRHLGTRIDLIDRPGSGLVFRLGNAEGSIAAQGKALTGVGVELYAERDARISGDTAILEVTNTQLAQVNGKISLIQDEQITQSNSLGALAQTSTTLQTTVGQQGDAIGGLSSALTTEAQTRATADGQLFARWSVRVDLGGRVAGVGLEADNTQSPNGALGQSFFLVRADSFAIAGVSQGEAKPRSRNQGESDADYQAYLTQFGKDVMAASRAVVTTAQNQAASGATQPTGGVQNPTVAVPFIVRTGQWTDEAGVPQEPGVFMRRAMVEKFVADTAYIREAAVTTLKIQDEAVTVPTKIAWANVGSFATNSDQFWSPTAWVDYGPVAPGGTLVIISFEINQVSGGGFDGTVTCYEDGWNIGKAVFGVPNNTNLAQVCVFHGGNRGSLANHDVPYEFLFNRVTEYGAGAGDDYRINNLRGMILGTKR